MKIILLLIGFVSAFVLGSVAQTNYTIDWFTIDGGVTASTGGVYSVSGTIGQPEAGQMSGGSFSIEGGFWEVLATVQTPDAPLLTIFRTSTNAVAVTWSSPSPDWLLQVNTNSVSSADWSNVTATITTDGNTKTHLINLPMGNRYYRLWKP